jgi:hypothetical protein
MMHVTRVVRRTHSPFRQRNSWDQDPTSTHSLYKYVLRENSQLFDKWYLTDITIFNPSPKTMQRRAAFNLPTLHPSFAIHHTQGPPHSLRKIRQDTSHDDVPPSADAASFPPSAS